ncbi:hypothetical protein [Methylorubrum zatmanii]|uniref:Uncharacterized protein n=1 Tax=Methylorubrum zatmanii TaxID=29429 RepID=A0ABW1WUY1_9HYPH|nr:hypothetical protein [Methylorubrum zatmanii]MBD8907858.1 hypothetical protein [Methylorubrum zatmanii]
MSPAIEDDIEHLVPSGKITWMFTDYSGDLPFADHKTPGELDDVTGLGIAVHIDTNGAAPGRCAATVRLSLHMT